MRTTFIETLCELAAKDERIWLLTGDLGYSVLERFAQRFPQRFVNVGVAEQNMTGVAAGLALCGKTVFTYSIANFPIMRCLEQIRNDVCYHNLNVKIVAVGGGLAYGSAGYTHHAVEDLAVMRAMPNMTVVAPGDPTEVRLATQAVAEHPGPCYLRLGKGGERSVHAEPPQFRLGEAIWLRRGSAVTIISTGAILAEANQAVEQLNGMGISTGLISMHTVRPVDAALMVEAAQQSVLVVAVEEHGLVGGLYEALASTVAGTAPATARLLPVAVSSLSQEGGGQSMLRTRNSLDAQSLVAFVVRNLP
jgi:transketolase